MRFNAASAMLPRVTTTRGSISSIILCKKELQLSISLFFGVRFASERLRGLHRTALVIKMSSRERFIEARNLSKFLPDWSPENGTRVRSAPCLPGASPINRIFASIEPLRLLNTALRSHRSGHTRQAAASELMRSKRSFFVLGLLTPFSHRQSWHARFHECRLSPRNVIVANPPINSLSKGPPVFSVLAL